MRLLKKKKACADAIGDTKTSDMLENKIQAKSNKINNWCKANNLKRDYSRELVSEQVVKKSNFTKWSDSGNIVSAKTSFGNEIEYNPNAVYNIDIKEYTSNVNKGLSTAAKSVAEKGYKDNLEHLELVNLNTGETEYQEVGTEISVGGQDF